MAVSREVVAKNLLKNIATHVTTTTMTVSKKQSLVKTQQMTYRHNILTSLKRYLKYKTVPNSALYISTYGQGIYRYFRRSCNILAFFFYL